MGTSAAPWYLHPVEDPVAWARLRSGEDALAFAVVNVDNGPGRAVDPLYRDALAGVRTPLVGYVDVNYGQRHPETVAAELVAWRVHYGITGVMLDRVPPSSVGHWSLEVIDDLRAAGASVVVANPGRPVPAELVLRADVTCVAEMAWDTYRGHLAPPPQAPPERVWHLIHSCPATHQVEAIARARRGGAGLSWATAGCLPNPWRTLQEVR